MAKIYKLGIANGMSSLLFAPPEEKQKDLLAKMQKAFVECGAERVLQVDSSWSSEQRPYFYVESYPSIQALRKFMAYLNEIQFLQYFNPTVVLGTPREDVSLAPVPKPGNPDLIYKLVVAKGQSPLWDQLPPERQKDMWGQSSAEFEAIGGKRILWADSSWCSEEYPAFFIETYPNIEALQSFTACLNGMNFLQYFNVITVIGTESNFKEKIEAP